MTSSEAKSRQSYFGSNVLPEQKEIPLTQRLIRQFNNPLIIILIVAGLVTFLLEDFLDSFIIISVIVLNAIVGVIQEGKAESALKAIRAILSDEATVLRDGTKKIIPAEQLVPGDIVFLEAGDQVPADLRLIESKNLKVDESMLTGESASVDKSAKSIEQSTQIANQSSMVFSGTAVVYGQARGVTVATGLYSEIGKIGSLVESAKETLTPLISRLQDLAKQITFLILIFGVLLFFYSLFINNINSLDSFLFVVGVAVAAIPEGLPAIITIILAVGTRVMAKNNALIRRLPAVETLGSVTVICSDKTGTLTKNAMTAVNVITAKQSFKITGSGYEPIGVFESNDLLVDPFKHMDLRNIILASALCNDSQLVQHQDKSWFIIGDPTEGALLVMAKKSKIELSATRIDQIPFESEKRFMASLNVDESGTKKLYLKGAPEKILEICNLESNKYWLEQIQVLAKAGRRVLAFASAEINDQNSIVEEQLKRQNFQMLGLVGLIDPPRPEAITSIQQCHSAGIVVKMITGDHADTALSIADELGLNSDGVLTGEELKKLSDKELLDVLIHTHVIARADPEDKMRVVGLLQSIGHYVAMTGDGVNDAPALKLADIGIAMGKKGTDAARNSSDLVLTDNNFSTITKAVMQGRVVFDNIKKSLLFMLPTNGGETGLIVSAIVMGITMPITVAQILWVNMVTTITLDFALAFERPEENIMKRPPRSAKEKLITKPLVYRIIFVSILMTAIGLAAFYWELSRGNSIDLARTTVLNALVFAEITYLLNVKYFTKSSISLKALFENRFIYRIIIILIILQISITYLPFFNNVFNTTPIGLDSWGFIILIALAKFFVVEIEKFFWRRADRSFF